MKDTKRQNRMWGSKGIIGKRDCPGPTRGKQTNDLYSTRGHITPQPLCGLLNRSLCVSACYDAAADNHHNTCVVVPALLSLGRVVNWSQCAYSAVQQTLQCISVFIHLRVLLVIVTGILEHQLNVLNQCLLA